MPQPRTLLIVAARNEAQRIGSTLAALAVAFPGAEVWVADDGSRDHTASIARAAGARVLSGARGRGKGTALTAAAREVLRETSGAEAGAEGPGEARSAGSDSQAGAQRGEAVGVICDGDLGESARELAPLAQAVRTGSADIAVAAFATRAGGGFGIAVRFARWAIARRGGYLARAPLSGQRALTPAALSQVLPFARGYGMEVAMTIDALRAGLRVREIELELSHRASGRTPAGFAHRARQLADVARAYLARAQRGG